MDSRPLIRESLRITTMVGVNPFYNTIIKRMYAIFIIALVILAIIDGSYLVFNNREINSAISVSNISGLSQVFMNMWFFVTKKADLKFLINTIEMFWNPDSTYFQQDKEVKKIFYVVKTFMRFHVITIIAICILYLAIPLVFMEPGNLPWVTNCSQIFGYKTCYAYEIIILITCCPLLCGFDALYISLTTNIICELRLLKNRFSNLKVNSTICGTDKEAMDELKELIDHHNLILRCIKIMKNMYKGPILKSFFHIMGGLCFFTVIITLTEAERGIKLVYVIALIFYFSELFLLCIFGTILTDENDGVTYAVYESQWWIKSQPEFQKALVMVMRRANQPEILTAGGVFDLNLETFTKTVKATFSFYTFIQTMYDET